MKWPKSAVNALPAETQPQGWGKSSEPTRKRPSDPESQLQQAFIRAFALIYAREWQQKRLHSVPNGGKRTKGVAGRMKAEGQVSGVWDLQLTIPRGSYHGLWLETKAGKGRLSPEQQAFKEAHEGLYQFAVYYTVEEGLKAVAEYLALPAVYYSISYER